MHIPDAPGDATAPMPPVRDWLARATDHRSCVGAFARFGMGFCPELIAPFDATRRDDAPVSGPTRPFQ